LRNRFVNRGCPNTQRPVAKQIDAYGEIAWISIRFKQPNGSNRARA
jgi:hypothetical protein